MNAVANFGLTSKELRKLRSLKDPYGIQKFLDSMPYHLADTAWSPRVALREHTSHCFEGAMLAATALRVNGYPPLVFDLEGEADSDHVVAVYRERGHWGAIAKSNFAGLRYREPVYRSLRELAMSYFEHYFNLRGDRSLRTFSRPVNLARFDRLEWMTTEKPLWFVAEYLFDIFHYKLLRPGMVQRLHRLDSRSFAAGCVGHMPPRAGYGRAARDLARPQSPANVEQIFELGSSGGPDIARNKDSMIAEAFLSTRKRTQCR